MTWIMDGVKKFECIKTYQARRGRIWLKRNSL